MNGTYISRRIYFAVLFVVLAHQAVRTGSNWNTLIIGWFAANAMAMSLAYFMNCPWVFGKTEQGHLRWIPALLMAPFLFVIRVVWTLQNMFVRSARYNKVAPDLFVGRICGYESLPDGITIFVDLTAEFPTPRSIRTKLPTVCLPTLDACNPDWDKCRHAFELIEKGQRRVYVCCANGHGRSITFVAAWLGRSGICHSAIEAVKLIQASRPSAKPNQDQMSFLNQAFQFMQPICPNKSAIPDEIH